MTEERKMDALDRLSSYLNTVDTTKKLTAKELKDNVDENVTVEAVEAALNEFCAVCNKVRQDLDECNGLDFYERGEPIYTWMVDHPSYIFDAVRIVLNGLYNDKIVVSAEGNVFFTDAADMQYIYLQTTAVPMRQAANAGNADAAVDDAALIATANQLYKELQAYSAEVPHAWAKELFGGDGWKTQLAAVTALHFMEVDLSTVAAPEKEPAKEEPAVEEPAAEAPANNEEPAAEESANNEEPTAEAPMVSPMNAELTQLTEDWTGDYIFDAFVSNNVKFLIDMYGTGFDAIAQEGLLADAGHKTFFYTTKTRSKLVQYSKALGVLIDFMRSLQKGALPVTGTLKPLSDILPNVDETVCHLAIHLAFQSACEALEFNIGIPEISIKEWAATNNNAQYCTQTGDKIQTKQGIWLWYTWSVSRITALYLDKCGLTKDSTSVEKSAALVKLTPLFTNTFAITEYTVHVAADSVNLLGLTVRCSSSYEERLVEALTLFGKGGVNRTTYSVTRNSISDDGLAVTYTVVLDTTAKPASDVLFAHEVLDGIIANGTKPDWSHALLGRSETGELVFWDDFCNPKNEGPVYRVYAIYAGSRSGKGIMTSSLISNALCGDVQVFYTDGKPENGACIGELAWECGEEAYIFDGNSAKSTPFVNNLCSAGRFKGRDADLVERYTNKYVARLPRALFEVNDANIQCSMELKRTFTHLNIYLRSLQCFCAMVAYRGAGESVDGAEARKWQVWVFDEVSNMATLECAVCDFFIKYLSYKASGKEPKSGTTMSDAISSASKYFTAENTPAGEKEAFAFIRDWYNWLKKIPEALKNARSIALGKAGLDLIFIFQQADWLMEKADKGIMGRKDTILATLCKTMECTKIVGNNAISDGCNNWGNAPVKKFAWYSKVCSDAYWAICKDNVNDCADGPLRLFKPFSVWTTPIGEDKHFRDYKPGETKERYFKPYVTKLYAGTHGISEEAAGQQLALLLRSAFNDAEAMLKAKKQLGDNETLFDYMYNCATFSTEDIDTSINAFMQANKENNVEESYAATPIGFGAQGNSQDAQGTSNPSPAGNNTNPPPAGNNTNPPPAGNNTNPPPVGNNTNPPVGGNTNTDVKGAWMPTLEGGYSRATSEETQKTQEMQQAAAGMGDNTAENSDESTKGYSAYGDANAEPISFGKEGNSPFAVYQKEGSAINNALLRDEVTKQLVKAMSQNFGGLGAIYSFAVDNGMLVINGKKYAPKLPEDEIKLAPNGMQGDLAAGKYAVIFHFGYLRKMSNLISISIDDKCLAKFAFWRDLGVVEGNLKKLNKRLPHLEELKIGGVDYFGELSAEEERTLTKEQKKQLKEERSEKAIKGEALRNAGSNVAGFLANIMGFPTSTADEHPIAHAFGQSRFARAVRHGALGAGSIWLGSMLIGLASPWVLLGGIIGAGSFIMQSRNRDDRGNHYSGGRPDKDITPRRTKNKYNGRKRNQSNRDDYSAFHN